MAFEDDQNKNPKTYLKTWDDKLVENVHFHGSISNQLDTILALNPGVLET